ncbi:MAG: VWA domain-containing protein [Acidobacteria bacterium]|nr:VWA domain-containing protein [Acidobacteriota bacterium]MBV9927155.1 VWA domain-containing protein [Acidobacteriota bacterium]
MLYPNPSRKFVGRLFLLSALLLGALAGASAQTAQEKEDVVRVESELVQTDVMVFDKSGKFVDGLTREQFELKIDGKPVAPAFFERMSAPAKGVAPGTTGAAAAANRAIAAGAPRRTIIFFIDDLHLALDSLNPTRLALTRFIEEEMAPGDLVAFVTASGQLGFLQQFTDNKAVLRAAVARLRNIPHAIQDNEIPPMSEYIAARISNGDREAAGFYITKITEGFFSKAAVKQGGGQAYNANAVFEMVKTRANNITRQAEAVTNGSLSALEKLVQVAGQIEGRKLVFFVSDGFYLGGKGSVQSTNRRLQLVTDTAARTGTVIYTIDARGLFAPFNEAAGTKPRDPSGALDRASVGEATATQEGLANLAGETGGEFLKNQNYFDHWVSHVVDETSNYYRIAWKPEGDEQKGGRYRNVEVAVVGRPDLTVRLHRGYVPAAARAAEEAKEKKPDANAAPPKPAEPKGPEADFRAALTAPAGRVGLPTALSVSFVDVPSSGPVVTASVEVATDALDYGADGKQPASVDMVGVVLNDQGKQVSNFSKRLTVAPSAPGTGAAGEQPGVIYNHKAPLAPGLYQVKAAARDVRGGQLGSAVQWIEIPDLSKKQLSLSSLHLGGRQVGGGAGGGAPQVQFSVDRRFTRGAKVDFLGFVYNASQTGGQVDLSVNLRVLRNNRAVVASPARKLAPEAGADLARIPVTGAISLGQLPPGRYELEVAVGDNLAHTKAAERVMFEIK